MEVFFIHLVKSSGILVLFWAVYHLFLKKETFFNSTRWFLNFGLIASIVIPFIYFKTINIIEVPTNTPTSLPTITNETAQEISVASKLLTYAFYGYLLGILFFSTKLLIQLASLYRFIKKGTLKKGNFNYVLTNENMSPFSFFNYIVYNPNIYKEKELEAILTHEQIHAKQHHSIDVIFLHIYTIVFWINPIAWLYKKEHTQNLEYITDLHTSNKLNTQKEYQYLLLKQLNGMQYSIINPFYNSLIKKRIVMLQKQKSHKKNLWKYSLILPLLAGFMMLFSFKTVTKFNHLNENTTNQYVITKQTTDNELEELKNKVQKQGNKLIYSNLKRNSSGLIKNIKIKYIVGSIKAGPTEFSKEEGIGNLYFGTNNNTVYLDIEKSTDSNLLTEQPKSKQLNDPIYVIDGKIMPKDFDVKSIDPESIYSMNVIKGESAIEKYGEKGRNGVVEIFLKDSNQINLNSSDSKNSFKISSTTIDQKEKPLYVLDGKILHEDFDINTIDPSTINHINVLKDINATKKYGDEGKNGVIEIVLETNTSEAKNKSTSIQFKKIDPNQLIILDGKEISHEEYSKIDREEIRAFIILKDGDAVEKYGEKGKNGVIIIQTKGSSKNSF
ncbi:M56 family metallopeptidase [Galbibacter orientalis]|uniref:M56 family metallopeptidase n=1 Tax=Galbibacter orientalis TaxID=453852 RepID=UPI00307FEBC9